MGKKLHNRRAVVPAGERLVRAVIKQSRAGERSPAIIKKRGKNHDNNIVKV